MDMSSCSVKRGLNAFAKSIDPCQLAQFAQADIDRNFRCLWIFDSEEYYNFVVSKGHILDSSQTENSSYTAILNLMKMAERSPKG